MGTPSISAAVAARPVAAQFSGAFYSGDITTVFILGSISSAKTEHYFEAVPATGNTIDLTAGLATIAAYSALDGHRINIHNTGPGTLTLVIPLRYTGNGAGTPALEDDVPTVAARTRVFPPDSVVSVLILNAKAYLV